MFDVAIIGLGPAGLRFLDLSIKHKLNIIAFEKDFLGGVCLNYGCIPTKSILKDSEIKSSWKDTIVRKNKIISTFQSALKKKYENVENLTIIKNEVNIIDKNTVVAGKTEYKAKLVIYAGGSCDIKISGLEPDHDFILNSCDIFNLPELPQSILIVGSGAIGIEWARIFNNFGVKVSIVEKAQTLAPNMDKDISKRLERVFKKQGISFYTNTQIDKIENKIATLSNGKTVEADKILVAIGKKPNKLDTEGVISIGDSNPLIMLAHSAEAQAEAEFNNIFSGFQTNITKNQIPSVIYGEPEIASIGLREQDLENLENYKIINFPLLRLAKAHCDNFIDGFIKIIADNKGKIVGAHILSYEASAIISQFAILMHFSGTLADIENIIFPHPSLSEGIKVAVQNNK